MDAELVPARPESPAVTAASKNALWELAGLRRTREGLERLLADEHPLTRLIARCALSREETRGVHSRSDFRKLDPELDNLHTVIGVDGAARLERWD
jgi:L-aspartate oxidase